MYSSSYNHVAIKARDVLNRSASSHMFTIGSYWDKFAVVFDTGANLSVSDFKEYVYRDLGASQWPL